MNDATGELIFEDSITMLEEDPTDIDVVESIEFSLIEALSALGYDVEGATVEFAAVKVGRGDHKEDEGYMAVKLTDGSKFSTMIVESVDPVALGLETPVYLVEIRKLS